MPNLKKEKINTLLFNISFLNDWVLINREAGYRNYGLYDVVYESDNYNATSAAYNRVYGNTLTYGTVMHKNDYELMLKRFLKNLS